MLYLWPDPERGPWLIELDFAFLEGRPECVGFHIRSVVHDEALEATGIADRLTPTPLTRLTLRQVPLGRFVTEERQRTAASLRGGAGDPANLPAESEVMQEWARRWAEGSGRKVGRPVEYGPEHWPKVAEVYRDARAVGSERPRMDVAKHFRVSPSAAAKWIARCRAEGLLPPTEQGRAR